jgi:hypothetical protein
MKMTATQSFYELSPQQQEERRGRIGVRAQAILSQFWQKDTDPVVRVMELESWMDILEPFSEDEIRKAWNAYMCDKANRNSAGRLLRPDPGALRNIILNQRPRAPHKLVALHKPNPQPERKRVTQEQAEQIMRDAGFRPKVFGGADE